MKYFLFILLMIAFCAGFGCKRVTDPLTMTPGNKTVYYYLSDSTGSKKTEFLMSEDIFFHFGVINNQDSAMSYSKNHGGPPIASLVIFDNDSIFGYSDYGYAYPAIVVSGRILPNDTLEYSTSWYSNPHHTSLLENGSYYTTVSPYIWFADFNLTSFLDTVYFEIK